MSPSATKPVFLIAEAGVNHDGDEGMAMRLVEAAAAAKADAVKFQTWKPGEITGRFAYKVDYIKETTSASESRYELSKRLALPFEVFRRLQAHAKECGILFLSTPDGHESLDFLADELAMPIIKVGSTEVTHPQLLEHVGRKKRPVILSTGLSDLPEVREAVASLRRGGAVDITVLQCTSQYPAPDEEMNLRAMVSLREALGLPVGLSDHSTGSVAAIAAVALGASVVEKHFTHDRSAPGPDHKASLDPAELAEFVRSVRRAEAMLGDGIKKPTPSELRNRDGIRRSVVAARDLPAGTLLERAMLACKRPGGAVAPRDLDQLVGKRLKRALSEDEPVRWESVE